MTITNVIVLFVFVKTFGNRIHLIFFSSIKIEVDLQPTHIILKDIANCIIVS